MSSRGLWAWLLAAVIVGVGAIGFAGSASAGQERAGGNPATIKMKLTAQGPVFTGPRSVEKGERLRIINRTSFDEIGPHTFTLVRKGPKPFDRIFQAHQAGPPPDFPIGKRVVDAGKRGWDRAFTRRRNGDSWYTEDKGDSHSRKVRANVGKTIRYFCAIHPEMKGKFEVRD